MAKNMWVPVSFTEATWAIFGSDYARRCLVSGSSVFVRITRKNLKRDAVSEKQ